MTHVLFGVWVAVVVWMNRCNPNSRLARWLEHDPAANAGSDEHAKASE